MRSYFTHAALLQRVQATLDRHRRSILIGLGALFIIVIAAQLLYPQDKALPLAYVDKQSVALRTRDELSKDLQDSFGTTSFTIQVSDKKVTSSLAEAGAELKLEAMLKKVIDYPLWQRFIPFSIFAHRTDLAQFEVSFSDEQLKAYADNIASQLSLAPVDAGLTIVDGKLVVTDPRDGHEVTPDAIRAQLASAHFTKQGAVVQLKTQTISPKRNMKDIEPVRAQAESLIAHQLTLQTKEGKLITVQPGDIAAWLQVTVNDDGAVVLSIKDEAVAAYSATIAGQVDIAPGVAQAKLVDGLEVGRTSAPSGLGVDRSQLVNDLKAAVQAADKQAVIKLKMGPVEPKVQYDRSYSSTQAGLQAYINYVSQSSNTRIAIAQLDGNGWSAGARANESTVSASTYKVLLSLVLFSKIDAGELHWNDQIQGYSMATCLEKTIVVSANECAEELLGKFGRTNINNFLYGKGISKATTFTDSTATRTSAADLNKVMIGIQNGSLLSGDNRSNLLDKMSRQVYRSGIPAGSKGSVQDKVGFLWDYLNDTAIVHHPKGTYVMTIMTKGSSWGNIAQITRDVEGIMYP